MPLKAQETEYLFNGNDTRFGGFGGPIFQLAGIGDQLAFYNGGGGGAIINGRFFIGGYGMGLSSEYLIDPARIPNPRNNSTYELNFGHGGLWLGYNFKPSKLIHFSLSTSFGGGQYSIEEDNDFEDDIDEYASENVFVISPMVGAEMNIVPWCKIAALGGYQYVSGGNSPLASFPGDLSSPVLQLQLKFGYFPD